MGGGCWFSGRVGAHVWVMTTVFGADVTTVNFEEINDVHVAAGLLKLYFRELDSPAFTDELYQAYIDAASTSSRGRRAKQSGDRGLLCAAA